MRPQMPTSKNFINLLIALVLGVLWAFLWAIDQLMTYLLFGCACFFLALFFYNRKIAADERNIQKGANNRSDFNRIKTNPSIPKQPTFSNDRNRPQFVILVSLAIGVVFVFTILYSVIRLTENAASADAGYSDSYDRAEEAYALNEYDSAYYFYKQALKEDSEMEEAWLGLGNTLHMQSKTDSSLLSYQKALEVNPGYSAARYNIGWWYYNQKQYAQAIMYSKSLVNDEPDNASALQLIGDSYYDQNQYDSAMQWYEGAYEKGSRSRWLCHVLGYLNDRGNNVDNAISLYKEALQYDTTVTEIYVRLGDLLPGQEGENYRYRAAQLKMKEGN